MFRGLLHSSNEISTFYYFLITFKITYPILLGTEANDHLSSTSIPYMLS